MAIKCCTRALSVPEHSSEVANSCLRVTEVKWQVTRLDPAVLYKGSEIFKETMVLHRWGSITRQCGFIN